jgi:predicted dehydrogenase
MRLAIIGGGFGRYGILPAFLLNDNVEIVAVCTRHQETAEAFAKQYQVPKAFHSWRAILEEDIDMIAIVVPPIIQAEITTAALEKKIPLFLEKQIALDAQQSQQLLEIANRNQVATCVNFIFPYLHTWQLMHSYLSTGAIGQIRQVFLSWRMESYDNHLKNADSWKTNDTKGGGILQHFLSHSFYYLEFIFGKIHFLRCMLTPTVDLHTGGSTFASLDLVLPNDVIAHVAASSSAYAGAGHSLEIYGSEGSLILQNTTSDPVAGFKLYYAARGEETKLIDHEARYLTGHKTDSRVMPTSRLINTFLKSLTGESIKHPTIRDGHRVQHLLQFAKVSNSNQQLVRVTE